MTNTEKSIIQTLAFFDVFDYPLTLTEIWKWLYRPGEKISLSKVKEVITDSKFLKGKLSFSEGFYSLKGKEHIYLKRKHNNNLAERKFRRAIHLVKVYRFIPFVRMIAVCNTLAYSNANENSDIDFFIITKKGTIWLARFFTILLVNIFGLRPKGEKKRDTFCLSFFVDENHLDIQRSMLNKNDIYYPYWVSQMMPIYNPDGLYEKFLKMNKWHRDYLPNSYANNFSKEVKETPASRFCSRIFRVIVSPPFFNRALYGFYRRLQVRIIDRNLRSLINVDTRVIVNEEMLKFYPNDNRELFYKKWREKVHSLLYLTG
ncbi:hypothetical protein K8R42_04570 [bacterium]|nr:hypothetical protein [bacterium]